MATPVLFAFSLCLVLCAVSSKPVAHDSGSLQSTHSADSVLKRTLETVSSSEVESARDSKQVKSLDGLVVTSLKNSEEGLRRVRREAITGNGCPGDMIWFMQRCMSFELYEQLVKENEAEK